MCMDEQCCEASSKPALTMPTVVPESVQLPSGPIAGQPADPPAANAREGYAAGVASVALLCHLQVEHALLLLCFILLVVAVVVYHHMPKADQPRDDIEQLEEGLMPARNLSSISTTASSEVQAMEDSLLASSHWGGQLLQGLDQDAILNAVDRDTGNKLDGSELCRKHPGHNVIVVADSDGNPADDLLSGFYDSGSEDPWRMAKSGERPEDHRVGHANQDAKSAPSFGKALFLQIARRCWRPLQLQRECLSRIRCRRIWQFRRG
ncbi:hypothetical protein AK812_SmicGene5988 [Symbiodinium microadriaticum]|uniref:Uncharacterized protein n=1 Tax=Symbiodinium microadriaticum TaxID=2951 RepID=A0A1Q9ES89_SYMMI|nr:hypothetical protein AK812_SmicGene5988 [Symbiodinium microadriaticum]